MSDAEPEAADPTGRPALACPRCGATVAGDQSWCLECGLAARTSIAPTPAWRTPLVVAGAIGLAAMAAMIVAFLVLTADNAPLPTTAATVPATATTVVTTAPATTTATAAATVATIPTTPGTTPVLPSATTETVAPTTTMAP